MLDFYVKMMRFYMDKGLTFEQALLKVPAKWQEAVREAMQSA